MSRREPRQGWVGMRDAGSYVPSVPVIEEEAPAPRRRKHRPKHRAPEVCEAHEPIQHRDGKPPWCPKCGLDGRGRAQTARGRLTLVVRACDAALASPELDEGTRLLIEAIRDQAEGGD